MLAQVGRGVWALAQGIAGWYLPVTVVVVVLAEVFVLGYLAPRLLDDAELHTQVTTTASAYVAELSQRFPHGVPAGTLLGDRGGHVKPGTVQTTSGGSALEVPAITGPVGTRQAVTAVVFVAQDGTVVASSAPSRYPPGSRATSLPIGARSAIGAALAKGVSGGTGATPFGTVSWTLFGINETAPPEKGPAGNGPAGGYLYVQAPQAVGFANPIRAWAQLGELAGSGNLAVGLVPAFIAVAPLAALAVLLASRRLLRRVRLLEQATVAVTDGDYTVTVPVSRRGDVGRLEANVAAMTRQLNSALAAERERAGREARAAERSRIARDIHDAISQHLFGLRMIASGMRRADPENEQARAIERITQEALGDMQALLRELRPPGLEGAGLAPALEQICAGYRERLGVTVDADLAGLDNVVLPARVEDALLRVAQEACTNAVRHGHARQLAVSMARRNGTVEMAVRDDGTGFDPANAGGGSGLGHIRDRVRELGGTVDIDSAPGAGAAVTVRVPAP